MDNYFVISNPTGEGCVNLGQGYAKICLIKEDCNPSDPGGNLVPVGSQWNCNLCQTDMAFWLPILSEDTFMFQTRFFDAVNDDPENPEAHFSTLEVYDEAGDVAYNEETDGLVIRRTTAHTGKSSYQLYEIDFDLIDLDCFSIKLFTEDGQEVVTQHFTRKMQLCRNTTIIRSNHIGRDNAGNYYGAPFGLHVGDLMSYDNAVRVGATIQPNEYSMQKTVIGRSRVTDVVTEDISLLVFDQLLPPWMVQWLTKVILSGQYIEVNGRQYESDSYNKKRDDPHQSSFFVEVPLIERVSNSGYEC